MGIDVPHIISTMYTVLVPVGEYSDDSIDNKYLIFIHVDGMSFPALAMLNGAETSILEDTSESLTRML